LFVLCISLVFGGKYMEFRIIFSLQYSISIDTFEVHPPSDSLDNAVVKPKIYNMIVYNTVFSGSCSKVQLFPGNLTLLVLFSSEWEALFGTGNYKNEVSYLSFFI
jgi:hypothetical protein